MTRGGEPLNEYEWLKQYDEDYEEAFGPVEDERDREVTDPVDEHSPEATTWLTT